MATQSPIPFLDALLDRLQAPAWVVDEVQHRMVLFLNHMLMQEAEARARLSRQTGHVVLAQWRSFTVKLRATPAGLLERADAGAPPDLTLAVVDESPLELARKAFQGEKPSIRIEGDVQFAAEINWLVEHLRWDLEEDLSRLLGDAPAHALADAGRRAAEALRRFVASSPVSRKPDA